MKLPIKLNRSVRTSSPCSSSASSPTSTSPRKKFGLPKLHLGRSASRRERSEGEHLHREGSAASSATSTPTSTAGQDMIGSLSPMLSKGYAVEDVKGVRMKGVPAGTAYLQELEEVFAQFDANGDGKISAEELRSVLSSLGEDVTREEAALMVADIDRDGDGFIDLAEFVEMNRALQAASTDEEEMAAAFAIFDLRKDGKIRAEDLQQVLVRMGRAGSQLCSIEECRRMISGVDRKGLGHVDYDDFKRMMTPLVLP